MSMGIPVICNSGVGDTDEIIQMKKVGILIDELTEENFDSFLKKVLRFSFDKTKIREQAKNSFSTEQ